MMYSIWQRQKLKRERELETEREKVRSLKITSKLLSSESERGQQTNYRGGQQTDRQTGRLTDRQTNIAFKARFYQATRKGRKNECK